MVTRDFGVFFLDHRYQQHPPQPIVVTSEVRGWFEPSRDGGYIRRAGSSYLAEPGDAWVPPHLMVPKPDKCGWWPHGLSRVERLRCGAAYASKYASKGLDGASFPKGLRLHGRGGLTTDERVVVRWWLLAKWVREHFREAMRDVRKITGGYVSRSDGEWLASPWRVHFEGGVLWVVRIA